MILEKLLRGGGEGGGRRRRRSGGGGAVSRPGSPPAGSIRASLMLCGKVPQACMAAWAAREQVAACWRFQGTLSARCGGVPDKGRTGTLGAPPLLPVLPVLAGRPPKRAGGQEEGRHWPTGQREPAAKGAYAAACPRQPAKLAMLAPSPVQEHATAARSARLAGQERRRSCPCV